MFYYTAKFVYFLVGEVFSRLAGFGFFAIFIIFWRKTWRIFVQDLDQCCFIKSCKNPLNIAYCPEFIFPVVYVVCTSAGVKSKISEL